MFDMRWHKILREIWSHKLRTTLVVLSIAAGVFVVGMLANTRSMLSHEMTGAYLSTQPAHVQLKTDPFENDLIKAVGRIPGVVDVEGRGTLVMRLFNAGKEYGLGLETIANYDHIPINQVRPISGDWPPPDQQLLLERRSLDCLGVRVGDTLLIEDRNGRPRTMQVAGVVYNPNTPIPAVTHFISGYITRDTQLWLDGSHQFNQLNLRVVNPNDTDSTQHIVEQVSAKIKRSGKQVYATSIPDPNVHPLNHVLNKISLLLGVLAVLTMILSGCLVINIISAVLTEQVRQIGLMKALGARSRQLVGMYLGMVLIFALLALLIAVPLGTWAGYGFTCILAYGLNVGVVDFNLSWGVLILQVGVGLTVPVLSALFPVLKGIHVTPHQAINDYGLGQSHFGRGTIDRLITLPQFRVVPRPLLMAIRNTFRRKARLVITLLTLTVASTVFVGVLGAHASILRTFDLEMSIWQYDVTINFSHTQRIEQLRREAMRVPGVVAAESWNYQSIHQLRSNGSLSREMTLIALPAATIMLKPVLVAGRWLLPDDGNAVVINIAALKANPDVKLGDEIQLKFKNQRPTQWRVVGLVMGVIAGPILYVNQPYFAHLTKQIDRAEAVQIVATHQYTGSSSQTNAAFQAQMAKALETHFEQAGLPVASTMITVDRRSGFTQLLNIFTIIFSLTSIPLAVVGGLGLTGTMSINILERTREIGVMRTIGASDGMVQQMVLAEGIFVALLSWGCGTLLAWPFGQIVNWLTGTYLLRTPLQYTFSTNGALLWLGVVIFLAVGASYLPARAASHLTVGELLAYE